MSPEERHARILSMVRQRGRVTVDELSAFLDASKETIRRDLGRLDGRGLIRKFHGGAAMPEMAGEGSFQARMCDHVSEKRAAARLAAGLFQPGDSLFVDTGSTTVIFAEEVARTGELTVITNSAQIAATIARGHPGNQAILLGGTLRAEGQETVGHLALEQIARFRPRHAVLTVGAVHESGAMDYDLDEAEIARAMIRHAETVTVVADASKLGRTALFRICEVGAIGRLVCDREPGPDLARALAHARVTVHIPAGGGSGTAS
ncbi:MAG: DeoR/GlpR transcriptional regulator [Rhodospirillaceae bacterium]|nr:DeoR/GlpR transcriptional regulator [Rhodospirillaceae bacterium]